MDLYISPLSCSLAVHVALIEAGLPHTLHRVDRRTKLLPDGRDFHTIAPLAIVPALALPDGSVLTESAATLQWVADQAPDKQLAPPWGSVERYRLVEWINFITTELHKKHIWMIFSSKTSPPLKEWSRANAEASFAHVARHLDAHSHLLGDQFTVADAYLFWALFVAPHGGLVLDAWPSLVAYVDRLRERPSIRAALAIEGPLYFEEAAGHAAAAAAQPQAAPAAAAQPPAS